MGFNKITIEKLDEGFLLTIDTKPQPHSGWYTIQKQMRFACRSFGEVRDKINQYTKHDLYYTWNYENDSRSIIGRDNETEND